MAKLPKTRVEHFVSENMPDVWGRYAREHQRYLAGERADPPKIKIREHVKIEKFDGDKVEGQEPVEVIVSEAERSM